MTERAELPLVKTFLEIGRGYALVAVAAAISVTMVAAGIEAVRGPVPSAEVSHLTLSMAIFVVPLLAYFLPALMQRKARKKAELPSAVFDYEAQALALAKLSLRQDALRVALGRTGSRTLGLEEFKIRSALRRQEKGLQSDVKMLALWLKEIDAVKAQSSIWDARYLDKPALRRGDIALQQWHHDGGHIVEGPGMNSLVWGFWRRLPRLREMDPSKAASARPLSSEVRTANPD